MVCAISSPVSRHVASQHGLQRFTAMLGGTRDTNYLATYPRFMLWEDIDEYVIVYGINHQMTDKATYYSVSIYAEILRRFDVALCSAQTSISLAAQGTIFQTIQRLICSMPSRWRVTATGKITAWR